MQARVTPAPAMKTPAMLENQHLPITSQFDGQTSEAGDGDAPVLFHPLEHN